MFTASGSWGATSGAKIALATIRSSTAAAKIPQRTRARRRRPPRGSAAAGAASGSATSSTLPSVAEVTSRYGSAGR